MRINELSRKRAEPRARTAFPGWSGSATVSVAPALRLGRSTERRWDSGLRSACRKIRVVFFLGLVFGSADLVRLNPLEFDIDRYSDFRYLGLAIGLCALLAAAGIAFLRADHHVTPLMIVWLLFGCFLFASGVLHESATEAYGALWYLMGVPVVCFAAIPRLLRREGEHLLCWALILGDLPLLALSVAQYPLEFPFKGVTGNPNSLGVVAATLGCALFALLSEMKTRCRFWMFVLQVLGLFGSVVLTLASGSRTSALTLLLAASLFTFDWLIGRSGGMRKTVVFTALMALLAGGVALALGDKSSSPVAGIFEKSEDGRSTFLPQRGEIWAQTVSEATAFGHGEDYFEERFVLAAHNSVIGVLGQYGVAPAILFVTFGVGGLLSAWRYYRNGRKTVPYALMPLMMQVGFWGLSMGEGMFGLVAGSINVAFLISFGVTQYGGERAPDRTDAARFALRLCWSGLAGNIPAGPVASPGRRWRPVP